jgi:hypothetical protein
VSFFLIFSSKTGHRVKFQLVMCTIGNESSKKMLHASLPLCNRATKVSVFDF